MNKYTKRDIYDISNRLDDSIRAMIHLRRANDYYGIDINMNKVFQCTQEMVQKSIKEIEELFNYAEKYDYNLRYELDFLVMPYNYMLDLCENKVHPSEDDAERWDNKPRL